MQIRNFLCGNPTPLFCLFSCVAALSTTHNLCPSSQWTKSYRIPSTSVIQLRISLAFQENHNGEETLLELSNPASPRFGQHLSPREVVAAFAPPTDALLNTRAWIGSAGISIGRVQKSRCGGHLYLNATIQEAERLLRTEYYEYTHRLTGKTHIGCHSYELPEVLRPAVDFVTPTACSRLSPPVQKPIPRVQRTREEQAVSHPFRRNSIGTVSEPLSDMLKRDESNATLIVSCAKYTSPDCLRELYNIPLGGQAHPNNSFGIYQVAWSTWIPEDMDIFFSMFQPRLIGHRPIVEPVVGGFQQTVIKGDPFNLEANLDFQYAMALVDPQPVINLQVGDMYLGGNLNNLLASFDAHYCDALDPAIDPIYPNTEYDDGYNTSDCGNHVPPKVISISYAHNEADFPDEYLRRQCMEYLKLGLMGVTVVVATGDSGPAGGERLCLNPDTGIPDPSKSESGLFNPTFPASCPWVLAVGGTQRVTGSDNGDEVVYHRQIENHTSSSGGGFSNVFDVPSFQIPHTTGYLLREQEHLSSMETRFNPKGRGTPDVSALATEYLVVVGGKTMRIHGTSSSTPVWASIISKLNNERMISGKNPVGFINPVLYNYSSTVMKDVAGGHTAGCGLEKAFGVVGGWDAGTGLGSPLYDRLSDLLITLP